MILNNVTKFHKVVIQIILDFVIDHSGHHKKTMNF